MVNNAKDNDIFDIELYDEEDLEICKAFAIDIQNGEILTEFATVHRDYKYNMCLVVNPDKNRKLNNSEYFKVYNNADAESASKIARIKFRECDYVFHNNNGEKTNWKLNAEEICQLAEILNSPSKIFPDKNVWEELIRNYNNEVGFGSLPEDLEIPNYNDLKH